MLSKVRTSSRFFLSHRRGSHPDADLNGALSLEPNNTSIRDELKKVEQAIAVEKSKACVMFVPGPYMV